MADELLCMGCMKPINELTDSCYHCGYPAAGQNPAGYLPVRTQLAGRYVVGRALEKRSDAIVYIGYDMSARNAVMIREFYPDGLCDRLSLQIVANDGQETAFADCLEQFRKQARTIARLRDVPAMIPVYDLFEENGTMYTVSDRIEGITLRQYLKKLDGYMKWEDARPLFVPLINSLASVHAAGLCHLGISPDSLILDDDNRLRLDGWQLSCVRTEGGPLKAKLPVGYAAPEQYEKNGATAPSSDVYAVSAAMLFALTGEEPPAAIDRVNKTAALLVPAEVAEKWPAHIAPTLVDALMLDHAKRIASAEQLRERLTVAPVVEALIGDVSVAAVHKEDKLDEYSSYQPPARTGTGYKVTLIVLILLCLLLIGAVVWLLLDGNGNGNTDGNGTTATTVSTTTTAPTTTKFGVTEPTQPLVNPYAVEDVIGKTAEEVYGKTFRGNMTVEIVGMEYSDYYAKGTIIEQSPSPETLAEEGSVIRVRISAGPADSKPQSVVGWERRAAVAYLEALGYTVLELEVTDSRFEYGRVDKMEFEDGDALTVGAEIVLHISIVQDAPVEDTNGGTADTGTDTGIGTDTNTDGDVTTTVSDEETTA